MALRELIGLDSIIYALDKDRASLRELESNHRTRFNTTRNLILLKDDFSLDQSLPQLDGIVMANSLHFYRDKEKVLRHIRKYLKWNGALLLVEYNVDWGNPWVPHPLSFETFQSLAPQAGYSEPQLLAKAPFRDCDASPTKAWLVERRSEPPGKTAFDLSFGTRPAEELYDLRSDPAQLTNVVSRTEYADTRKKLSTQLMKTLSDNGDPRLTDSFDAPPWVERPVE